MQFASKYKYPWFDFGELTGLAERQLPRKLRAQSDTISNVESFVAACGGDRTMNPCEYDVLAGSASKFADFYEISLRQMRYDLNKPEAAFIHRLPGGLLATVMNSGHDHKKNLRALVSKQHSENARCRWRSATDQSPASNVTATLDALVANQKQWQLRRL